MRHPALAGTLASLLALTACGDDADGDQPANSTTAELATTQALCAAIDDVEQDIRALGDIDVLDEGTDAVEAILSAIREDSAEIREVAPETAPDEAEAFDTSLASLDDAMAALGDQPPDAQSVQDVVSAGASTIEAGRAYLDALDDACP
jgi:hypothetical protein